MIELPGTYPFAEGLSAVVFLDFDGTLTPVDIGDTLLCRYSNAAELLPAVRSGQLSVLEYYREVCRRLRATPEELAAAACEIGLRPHARELVESCSRHGAGVAILSDGFDAYILPVLRTAGMEHLPIACNLLRWTGSGYEPEFPWAQQRCQLDCPAPSPCAACKRAALLSWAPPSAAVVYVGDGMSDFCPALFADVVFARGELVDWCRSRGIGYIPYGDLFELRQRLEELFRRRRLFQRYLPLRRRQRAWVEE